VNDDLWFGPDFMVEDEEEQKKSLREGELREVAVLFADIKGFTNISNLFEPEVIHAKMDDIMKIFSRCISFYGGFVDKYIGDGIMALFGAKKATEQDTQRSVLAAIKMQEQLRLYNKLLNREQGFESVELGLRIGINTGLVSVGKVGESREGDFTVYGPQVNLASRMESNAPVNRIMLPNRTKQLVEHIFDFESKGPVNVKGMDQPIDCWLVIGQKSSFHVSKSSVFIGRQAELKELTEAFNMAKSGTRVIGIKGDAGIGKSRLLQEFCISKQAALILQGRCSSISPTPFNMFVRIIESYFEISHNSTTAHKKEKLITGITKLSKLNNHPDDVLDCLPLLAFLLEIKIPDARIEQKGKDLLNHILRAMETVLMAIVSSAQSQSKDIIMILDDIHLIDESSAHTLEFLLARFEQNHIPILIIALYRLDYPILEAITNHSSFKVMELEPLDAAQINELLNSYNQTKNLNKETLKLVSELSAGNPFYLEEWCNYISNLPQTDLDEYPVPGNLHALILSRLDALPQHLRLLLHKASVIGNEFFVEILREVESRLDDPVNLESTLGKLEEHSLIMKLLGFDFSTYFFKHITTREVAYQTLLLQNRKLLHELTAAAIEKLFADNLEDFIFALADHYIKAELPQKAIPHLKLGVDKAAKSFDNSLALKLGKTLLGYLTDPVEKAELQIKLADIYWLTGKWDEADALVQEAKQYIPDETILYCELLRFIGVAAFYKGNFELAIRSFEKQYQTAVKLDDKLQICIAQNNLGIWHQHHKQHEEAINFHNQSLKLSQMLEDKQREAKTLSNLGLIYLAQGNGEKGYDAFSQSLSISKESKFLRDESIALGNLGWCCYELQRLDEAKMWFLQKLELATKMNDKLEIINALGNLGNISFDTEDFNTALKYYSRSLALKEQLGNEQEIERSRNAVNICKQKLAETKS